jgi:RNA polymerase sigma-70 factor (ECF subfamily)
MLGPARAEEAVQEAFMSIWRTAATYDAERGLVRTWLLRIVRYRSVDILRRMAADDRRMLHAQHERDAGDAADCAATAVVYADRAAAVRVAVGVLPPDQRQVVELAFFDGLSQSEIAERLDIPIGTVKGRARLALTKLRSELEPLRNAE